MKKFMAGLLIGVLLSSGFVYAAQNYAAVKAEFKILVNGKQFNSTDKPAVVINGSTYLPLRAIGTALDVSVNWNAALKQVEIGDMNPSSTQVGILNVPNLQIKFSGYANSMGYRVFDVEVKNTGTTEVAFNPADLKCEGKEIDSTVAIGSKPMLIAGNLMPGSTKIGKVVFWGDTETNKTTFSLSYKGTYNTAYTSK